MDEPQTRIICSGCDREVEECAFCERDDCGTPICFRCMLFELKEDLPTPHDHGG
ncbi:MAG: hypothetical protein ACRDH8_08330 [Actinomycetota bacterium]